jgi:hypothetical protein
MRCLKLLGLTLVALLASAMALSMSASAALPLILPLSTVERSWTGKSVGETTLQNLANGNEVKCKGATAEGTEEVEKPLGLFHIHFTGCTAGGGISTCTGLGEASGVILALGKWHLVFDTLTPTLGTATLFLIEPLVHFTCSITNTLVLVLGAVLCLDLTPLTSSVTHEFHCKNNLTRGDPEETEYWNAAGTEKLKVELLSNENEGAEVMSAQIGLGTVTYGVAVAADD